MVDSQHTLDQVEAVVTSTYESAVLRLQQAVEAVGQLYPGTDTSSSSSTAAASRQTAGEASAGRSAALSFHEYAVLEMLGALICAARSAYSTACWLDRSILLVSLRMLNHLLAGLFVSLLHHSILALMSEYLSKHS